MDKEKITERLRFYSLQLIFIADIIEKDSPPDETIMQNIDATIKLLIREVEEWRL